MSSSPREYVIAKWIDPAFTELYSAARFVLRFFIEVFQPPFEFKKIMVLK